MNDKEFRLRLINKLLSAGVQDQETRYHLYRERNALRVEISQERSREVDEIILASLRKEKKI